MKQAPRRDRPASISVKPRAAAAMLLVIALCVPQSACRRREYPAAPDAVALAQQFLTALDRQQWDSAATLVDSADAARFRDERLMMIAGLAEHERDLTDAMSRTGSGGIASIGAVPPLDTALLTRHRGWRVRALDGAPTLADVAALPLRRFYARMYEAPANCWMLPRGGAPRAIGAVIDHDSLAHVVYDAKEPTFEGDTVGRRLAVLTLRRRGERWQVRPRALEPTFDIIALLDTSAEGEARMRSACAALGSGKAVHDASGT